jgi:hypothetical protein
MFILLLESAGRADLSVRPKTADASYIWMGFALGAQAAF